MAKSESAELDDLAFRLFAERISKMPTNTGGHDLSAWAYRKAEEFIATRERIKSGETTAAESKLSSCCAPNLKPTHPHNLVSQRFADQNGGESQVLAILKEIQAWLIQHPHNEENPPLYVNSRRGIDWDAPATKLARVLIPHYVN